MAKHLATHGLVGSTGRRHGTRMIFKFEDIAGAVNQPFFRWRNDACYTLYLEWLDKQRVTSNERR